VSSGFQADQGGEKIIKGFNNKADLRRIKLLESTGEDSKGSGPPEGPEKSRATKGYIWFCGRFEMGKARKPTKRILRATLGHFAKPYYGHGTG